jgi:dihydropteroate synthase
MRIRVIEIENIREAGTRVAGVGADACSVRLMSKKAVHSTLLAEGIDNRAANILKQDMLSLGGEVAVSRAVGGLKTGSSSALIMGTLLQLEKLTEKIARQPFGLREVSANIEAAISNHSRENFSLKCGRFTVRLGRTPKVMGILNVTPDSFSDGGDYLEPDCALDRAEQMASEGAAIIDIGGESTRPGAKSLSVREELGRTIPVVRMIAKKLKVPVSIDTHKPEVARAALDAGAALINDITGLRYLGGKMAAVAAKYNVPVIIMHMRGTPRTMQKAPGYKDVVGDILDFFHDRINFVQTKGIKPENIIIDPGIGFGKTPENNFEILKRLGEFKVFGAPLLVGTSRKSFIGRVTKTENPAQRIAGSIASAVWCAARGASILRVHDVGDTVKALKIIAAIRN